MSATYVIAQVNVPHADTDQINMIVQMARSLGGRVVEVGPLIQAAFPDTSQGEHQLRDWLEIVAASQAGNTIDILWWRANGGSL
jgi:hypothetical protein